MGSCVSTLVPAELNEQVLAEMPAIRASKYAALAEPRVLKFACGISPTSSWCTTTPPTMSSLTAAPTRLRQHCVVANPGREKMRYAPT